MTETLHRIHIDVKLYRSCRRGILKIYNSKCIFTPYPSFGGLKQTVWGNQCCFYGLYIIGKLKEGNGTSYPNRSTLSLQELINTLLIVFHLKYVRNKSHYFTPVCLIKRQFVETGEIGFTLHAIIAACPPLTFFYRRILFYNHSDGSCLHPVFSVN